MDARGSACTHRCCDFCSLSVSVQKQTTDSSQKIWQQHWHLPILTDFSQFFCHFSSVLTCSHYYSIYCFLSLCSLAYNQSWYIHSLKESTCQFSLFKQLHSSRLFSSFSKWLFRLSKKDKVLFQLHKVNTRQVRFCTGNLWQHVYGPLYWCTYNSINVRSLQSATNCLNFRDQ